MVEENFNLNNPNNLNPIVNPVYNPLPKSSIEAIEDSKEEKIKRWNEKPEVKNSNIKAIDTNKRADVDKKKFEFFKIMSFFGILALVLIAGAIATFAYLAYKDGTLIPNFICSQNITIPDCPIIPKSPDCINNCGDVVCSNFTCPANICSLSCDNSSG